MLLRGELRAMGSLPFGVQAFEYLKEAVVVVDENLKVIFLNQSASQLYEVPQEELSGQKIADLFAGRVVNSQRFTGFNRFSKEKGFLVR